MATDYVLHRLTTADYSRMVDAGVLADMPVELLDGHLVDVSPPGPEHAYLIKSLMEFLSARFDLLRVQLPLETQDGWVPEPDVALVEGRDRHAHPSTALLAVEVAVTMHREARLKAATYAHAGILRYWIVDVPGAAVIEHTDPTPNGYETIRTLRGDDRLDPAVDGIAPITVAQLLA